MECSDPGLAKSGRSTKGLGSAIRDAVEGTTARVTG